jgi:hypothetical protein
MNFADAFSIWLVFLLTGGSPRIWNKTVRQQHVASLIYQLAEVLRSMGNGGTFLETVGDGWRRSNSAMPFFSEFQLQVNRFDQHRFDQHQIAIALANATLAPFIQPSTRKTADALFTRSAAFYPV